MRRKSGAGVAAVLLAVTGVMAIHASAAAAACGPVDIVGLSTTIDEGESVAYDIDPGGCAASDYDVLVSGATTTFLVSVSPTMVSVTAKKDAATEHPQEIIIAVKRSRPSVPDDAVTVTLPGKASRPLVGLTFCVRDGGEDPVPWQVRVVLNHATFVDVHFSYAFEPGTAGFADFTPMGQGNGVVPAGALSATIPVRLNVDRLTEGSEWFLLQLTSVSGATILDGGGSCHNEIAANRT